MAARRNATAPVSDREASRKRLFGRPPKEIGNFAMLQPQRARVSTAAALHTVGTDPPHRDSHADDAWQHKAYDHTEAVGELGYVHDLKAGLTGRCLLRPQVSSLDEDGDLVWSDDKSPEAVRVLTAFVGPQGGTAELMRRYSMHIGIAGETYLVGSPAEDVNGENLGIFWEFVSTEELRVGTSDRIVRNKSGMTGAELDEDTYVARSWKSSPRFSGLAWSAMRRIAPIADELIVLTQLVEATAKSRLSAQLMFVADELSFAGDDDESGAEDDADADAEADDDIDPLTKVLLRHMGTPVADRTSAAALVPLIVRGPYDMKDGIVLVDVARDMHQWALALRTECLNRLAAGMDVPQEIVQGKKFLNHWTAYNIDADLINKHIVPDGELMADFVTYAYYRPMLEEFEGMEPSVSATRRLAFDPGPVIAREDEAATAQTLHELDPVLISDDALLSSSGFEEADQPDEAEVHRRRAWILLRTQTAATAAVFGPILIPEVDGVAVDWSKFEAAAVTNVPGPAPDTVGTSPDRTSNQEEPQPTGLGPSANEIAYGLLVERLVTAADHALEEAFAKAGSRLITASQGRNRDPGIRNRLRTVPKLRATTMVTPQDLDLLGVSKTSLLSGAWDGFSLRAREWIRDYGVEAGTDGLTADDRAAFVASALCRALEGVADERFFTGLPAPRAGLRVHRDVIELALAGASVR